MNSEQVISNKIYWAVAIVVLIIASYLYFGRGGAPTLDIVKAERRTITQEVSATGNVKPAERTVVGGLIGIAFGAGISFGASYLLTKFAGLAWLFSFPLTAALLGVGVSAGVGLIFGIYPAYQASRLSPTEALRYE